jgi:hypothetical protein
MNYRARKIFGLALVIGTMCVTGFAESASENDIYRIPRVEGSISVDARLDEPFWADALKIDANIEVRPAENVPAPVMTEALMAYTETHLYVAVIASDPDPSQIRANISDRDDMFDDDWIVVLFDTFNDQRRSYDFFCNPLGIQGDFIETSGGNNCPWDAIWDSDGRITDEGYIIEMSIPFECMNFQTTEQDQMWSFDVVRSYPRNVRHHIGAFPRDRNNNSYLSQAPKLIGFAGVKPGNNIEINPTLSGGYSEKREELDEGGYGPMRKKDSHVDAGLNLKWGITPSMTLTATLNPDFSQVEADAAKMDINTRFPLNYKERRPFFLEGADMYNWGGFVHTRTLADPEWGVKLTGKAGRNTIGAFTVRDTVTPLVFSDTEGADDTTLSLQSQGTVLRYKRDLFETSSMGVLITDREGTDYHNRLALIDADLRFTKRDQFSFVFVGTQTRYPDEVANEFEQKSGEFTGSGVGLSYNHSTENYTIYGGYNMLDPDFRADLGFETQVGIRVRTFGGEYRWRADGDNWYNWLSINASHEYRRDYDYNPLDKAVATDINYRGPMQSHLELNAKRGNEWYEGDRYRANSVNASGDFKPTASTEMRFSASRGDKIDYTNNRPGTRLKLSPSFEHKFGDRLSLDLKHRYEAFDEDEGRLYTGNVTNGKVEFHFTRRAFLRVVLQHVYYDRNVGIYVEDEQDDTDPETRKVFTQLMFSYKINPRTVFFLGYSDNYRNEVYEDPYRNSDEQMVQTNRAVFAKVGYAIPM